MLGGGAIHSIIYTACVSVCPSVCQYLSVFSSRACVLLIVNGNRSTALSHF